MSVYNYLVFILNAVIFVKIQFRIMIETSGQAYISKVHLKGYKSIRDLEIDFKPGLNIIIGQNGSGKTNFTDFMNYAFKESEYFKLIDKDFSSRMTIISKNQKNNAEISLKCDFIKEKDIKFRITQQLSTNGKVDSMKLIDFSTLRESKEHLVSPKKRSGIVKLNPLTIKINFKNELDKILENEIEANVGNKYIFAPFNPALNYDYRVFSLIEENSISVLSPEDGFKILDSDLINYLKKFTPIQDIKIDNESLNWINQGDSFLVKNIRFKFNVNNRWCSWYELSDGTKRLFYILITFLKIDGDNHTRVFLLEEPELGIHPDQLNKLMDFLIEQSKEKQIIITTHSPEVLNAIHPDELDRIIVTRYDAEKGTIMRKLTPEQAKEMGERIKEGDMFLSDRWVHLNLEDEIFNAAQIDEK